MTKYSGKYARLGEFLTRNLEKQFSLRFADIEDVLQFRLPPSAYTHRGWWSNNPNNNVMTKVWREAGFRTKQVDMEKRTVVFCRVSQRPPERPETPEEIQRKHEALGARIKQNKEGYRARMERDKAAKAVAGTGAMTHSPVRHPILGALKGQIRIVAGTDITEPADPNWGQKE